MRGYGTTLLTATLLLSFWFSNAYTQGNVRCYSIEQIEQIAKREQKKILIEVYTHWSDGFKQLERSVLNQQQIARYLNDNFLTVKLDAETRADINFRNRVYRFVQNSGVGFNELAAELLQGQMAYPTLVFLDERMNIIQTIPYRTPEQFEMLIQYFGDDYHKKMPWTKFEKNYTSMRR
jgi:thioredoxin-related protein